MKASYIVWGAWLAAFLVLELLGFWRVFAWVTFSETVWVFERHWLVAPVVFASLVALIAHFLYHRPLWHSVMFGLLVAIGAHVADKTWP